VNRVLSFFEEIGQLDDTEINALLDRQTLHTVKLVTDRSITFAGPPAPAEFHRGYWAS
jgi:hypothetical protein